VLLSSTRPAYPEFARRTGIVGDVEVEITIGENGRVTRASAVTGPSVLHAAAVAAVMQWRYQPATENGAPVSTRRRVRLSFQ
jgi:protein TonB